MAQLHIAHLQHDIRQFEDSMLDEVDRKGGQKTGKVDRKSGQKTCEAIVALVSENPQITTIQMAALLGINRSAISKHLKHMQAEGVVRWSI